MAEWLKAHDWKSCLRQRNQGSNPCLSAIFMRNPPNQRVFLCLFLNSRNLVQALFLRKLFECAFCVIAQRIFITTCIDFDGLRVFVAQELACEGRVLREVVNEPATAMAKAVCAFTLELHPCPFERHLVTVLYCAVSKQATSA